ncbi:hypothetical protein [Candidatus Thiodictyon syntrophicum]|jgi:hypothetical protein|uniref:Uncharacterized protein n=1 Tax=Candidatus Thiodictyon syntrophicum TaxID=1166950 RepID=A0A2K8U7M3_9GAMM|nr:hypothetical protein [Candidatus Thiodictyon syntrophicum]AUB81586.1 hypothetical protein THSYN_11875 [Candidatus Thiodictyon syntrophicum]
MKHLICALLLQSGCLSARAAEPPCAAQAQERAPQLLAFHLGKGFEERMGFEGPRLKSPLRNPANPKQTFTVLEIDAYVSPHGRYRMRFIFSVMPNGCSLMGEEILELANR